MLPNFPAQVPDDLAPKNRTVSMTDGLYQYLIDQSLREPEILLKLRRETAQYHMARMQIAPEVGQFLGLLVSLLSPKKLMEIGVFTGYSTLSIALSMKSDAHLWALEKKPMWLEIACRYLDEAGKSEQVTTVCGKALDSIEQLKEAHLNSFDFIFIDADKANLVKYYHQAKALLVTGGLMVIDNTLWWGNVADDAFQDKDTRIVRQLNAIIHQDPEVELSLLPVGDGLTLVRKK